MRPPGAGRWRAPAGDGQSLIVPAGDQATRLLSENRKRFNAAARTLGGRTLGELRAAAQKAACAAARRYTASYAQLPTNGDSGPLILTGHQPVLFHAGVWLKNFAIGRLASGESGTAINLIIDGDLCRDAAIQVPMGGPTHPRSKLVRYDQPADLMPHEERKIEHAETFLNFADQVTSLIAPLVSQPIVQPLWQFAIQRQQQQPSLGLCLSQARHLLELEWGNETLELPMSQLCDLPPSRLLIATLLADLPRFWQLHNGALDAYRAQHRLRNPAQPVPNLGRQQEWWEAPFWSWSRDDPRRQPLFARRDGEDVILADSRGTLARLPLPTHGSLDGAVAQLGKLAAERGWKLRTRALSTTLLARLLIADLFIHGIGGANYDVVTDRLIEDYFGVQPPAFITMSATFHLPSSHERATIDDARRLARRLRDLTYHAEKHARPPVDGSQTDTRRLAEIIATKQRWVTTPKDTDNAKSRHDAIAAANDALQPFVADERHRLEAERVRLQTKLRAAAILESREYSFCLFPRRHLHDKLLDVAARMR